MFSSILFLHTIHTKSAHLKSAGKIFSKIMLIRDTDAAQRTIRFLRKGAYTQPADNMR